MPQKETQVVVIGGGPAGLTAAYELTRGKVPTVVLEKSHMVGGLSRTEYYKGYRFDMGGHRFYTKSHEVKKMWAEVLGKEFLVRPRLSRIYYNNRFFYYPLKPFNVLVNLGLLESLRIMLSYLRWQLFPHRREETFEHWVTNRFGRRLKPATLIWPTGPRTSSTVPERPYSTRPLLGTSTSFTMSKFGSVKFSSSGAFKRNGAPGTSVFGSSKFGSRTS